MHVFRTRIVRLFCAAWATLLMSCGESPAPDHDDGPEPLAAFTQPIALAELEDENPDARVVEVSIEARVTEVEVEPGKPVSLWTYNGTMPGPLLRANVGDRVIVHFTNRLPEATTIHWHGLEIPAKMDGAEGNQPPVEPGERFDYDFVVPHAGTYWYHPHMDSAAQVWRGLYAPLIVDNPEEPELGVEAVVVLDDVMFEKGELASPETHGNLGDFFGREGDIMLVNGRVLPTVRARAGDALRLRFINAATSRYFRVNVEGHTLVRVGGDGGLLARPEPRDDVLLVPGERADLVLVPQGEPGDVLRVRSLPYTRFLCGDGCTESYDLMRIELLEGEGYAPEIPETLRSIEAIKKLDGAHLEEIRVDEGEHDGNATLGFNEHSYPDDPLELHASVGDTQVWHLDNPTDYDHPFHLHGFRFQVLEQGGQVPGVREWKDTLNLPARSDARIAIHFDDRPGMWMFHCHILDHAKIGMMGMLHVSR